ncbi:Uncharacterised protein [Mycobacteroides abscessus subsp. abscessus]|nr:Uncharacterised protein [Mycobacteroides abscessus subsp. abscessus]
MLTTSWLLGSFAARCFSHFDVKAGCKVSNAKRRRSAKSTRASDRSAIFIVPRM